MAVVEQVEQGPRLDEIVGLLAEALLSGSGGKARYVFPAFETSMVS